MTSFKDSLKSILRPIYTPLRQNYKRYRLIQTERARCRSQAAERLRLNLPVQLMLGAATVFRDGWITSDIPYLDMTDRSHWSAIFQPQSISYIVGEHVVEHLTEAQFRQFLKTVPEFLTNEHNIRIAIPDGYHSDPAYIENVRPGGTGPGADDHKLLYTCDLMSKILNDEGYEYRFLEYFDANRVFHRIDWDESKGYISRSQRNDPRNSAENPTAYTSLIVDFWKKPAN